MDDPGRFRSHGAGAAYPLGNKLARVIWQLSWLLLARWTPPFFWAWRRMVLRVFGAQIGGGARVHASVKIWLPSRLQIGDGALIGPGVVLYNQGQIAIGNQAVISQRAHLCASTHIVSDPDFALVERPIAVGTACWVAAEAYVAPGVEMGDGAVLAARGALFTDALPMTIYRGNPAQKISERSWRKTGVIDKSRD